MGKPSKFSKLAGPQKVLYASLDAAAEDMATDHIVFLQSGTAKKVTFSDVVADMDGTVTSTGLTSTDGVLSVSIAGLDAKTAPVAADSIMLNDSENSDVLKEVTLTNLTKPLADTMAGTASATALTDASGVLTVAPTEVTTAIAADSFVIKDATDSKVHTDTIEDVVALVAGSANTTGLTASGGVLTVAAKIAHLEAALLKGITTVPLSFETDEQTTTRIYFPMKVTIGKIRGIVMKAIAATDNGTITCGNSTGASASGVLTATASDALNTEYSASPTTNNVVLADGYYYLTSAKSTAGGKVLVTLEWTVTA
jgi:hypothetical protein